MSRLYNAIREQLVEGSRTAVLSMPTLRATDSVTKAPFMNAYTYEMQIILGVRATCPKEGLSTTLRRARLRVIEDVFGEFRGPIMRVYDKLFQRDVEGAVAALAELELVMFTERTES